MPKTCPLMSRPMVDTTGDWDQLILYETCCLKERCAWWFGNECAVITLAVTNVIDQKQF